MMDAPIPVFTIIPAQPGWYVAIFIPGGSEDDKRWDARFDLDPIIGWKIDHDHYHSSVRHNPRERCHHVDPITMGGTPDNLGNEWVIKRPDGRYEALEDRTFESEAEALDYMQASHEKEERRRAQKA